MALDRGRLLELLDDLGRRLSGSATICVIGSTPAIVLGQPDRQSQDIDVWRPQSAYDDTDFRAACLAAGLVFDPRGEIDPSATYVQIIRPGIINLPEEFEIEVLGRYGALTVAMPRPALLVAAKLVRGDLRDIEDVAWWAGERSLNLDEVRAAVATLPNPLQRETAEANVVLVELVIGEDRNTK
jgi:hypothetical protein